MCKKFKNSNTCEEDLPEKCFLHRNDMIYCEISTAQFDKRRHPKSTRFVQLDRHIKGRHRCELKDLFIYISCT